MLGRKTSDPFGDSGVAKMVKPKAFFIQIAAITTLALSIYRPLAADIPALSSVHNPEVPTFTYATTALWQYLRMGLNYLESPQPISPPESVPPSYVHPDQKGFGAYGFSPGAYKDVQRVYPLFRQYSWQDVMSSRVLYDLANQAYADWLMKNLQDYISLNADKKEVFAVLHQTWNLGLTGFKNGRCVVASRLRRAEEFKSK
jgi:hypothetical protein